MERGEFRKDLYYRLRVVPFHIPPLRERPEDISPISEHLLRKLAPDLTVSLSPATTEILYTHTWPGNVRELRNALEQALALGARGRIEPEHLLGFLASPGAPSQSVADLKDVEKDHIRKALRLFGGNKMRAAAALGISRSTLYQKIRAYELGDDL